MSLAIYKEHFDNAYQEVFPKVLVAKEVANTRFEKVLKYGESVERVIFDISGVRVRSVTRGSASTIDSVTDSSELITINLEKEAAFHISDGEVTQSGPLNPGEEIGREVARKVAIDLDGRVFAEVLNASYDFDNGDLTTGASTGTPITLSSTTVPQMVTRMPAKLRAKNNQDIVSSMILVVDSYAASDIAQYLLGKSIDLAGSVFKNGYTDVVSNAKMYVTENLTGEVKITGSGTFSNGETIVINGVTLTAVSTIGSTAGNFLIGADLAASLTNLAGLINNPGTTSATQVALSAANQIAFTDTFKFSAVATATTVVVTGIGSGRITATEAAANAAITYSLIHAYFGKKGAIDLVVQDMKEVDMRPTADRRGTNVFTSYLAGVKTFADGAKKFLDVLITA
jgi:hypothetical protein